MSEHHHNVYVILLDDAVAKHPSVLRLNPKREPSKPCVYVGMTGLPVEHRFENHIGVTAIFECKVSTSDFRRDARSITATSERPLSDLPLWSRPNSRWVRWSRPKKGLHS